MIDPAKQIPAALKADYRRKIVTLDRLLERLPLVGRRPTAQGAGAGGEVVVLCHGCFDIVHPGHIRYLQFARLQGDVLVVSITGDAIIDKGVQRPYIPQELRAENLAALEFVDYVLIDPHPTACELLQSLQPDVYVKGQEYATSKDPRFLAERRVVESYGGRVIFSSGEVVFSSTRLGEAMADSDDLAMRSLGVICGRHHIDRDGLSSVVEEMSGQRVLVLGDVVIDRYVLCDATNIAGESPMMALSELDKKDYLGGAAAVAIQAAALGARPLLATSLSPNAQADWTLRSLKQAGVEVHTLWHRPELAVKTRFLVDDHKVFKVDRTSVQPLDSIAERQAAELLVDQAEQADAVIIYDSGYGMITPGFLEQLAESCRGRLRLLTGGSVEPRGNLKALRSFDLLCTSERRLRVALNDFGSGLSNLAYQMMHETQARQMIATLGKRGLVTFNRPSHDPKSPEWTERLHSEHLPSFAGRVMDSLGCSETMLSVVTLALSGGASLMQAAYLASAAAAFQIAEMGFAAVTADRLERWIAERPELRATEDQGGSGAEAFRVGHRRNVCRVKPLTVV